MMEKSLTLCVYVDCVSVVCDIRWSVTNGDSVSFMIALPRTLNYQTWAWLYLHWLSSPLNKKGQIKDTSKGKDTWGWAVDSAGADTDSDSKLLWTKEQKVHEAKAKDEDDYENHRDGLHASSKFWRLLTSFLASRALLGLPINDYTESGAPGYNGTEVELL